MAVQLTNHIMNYHVDEMFQSAYKIFDSTETAMVKIHNDILRSVDNNDSVVLPIYRQPRVGSLRHS